MDIQTGSRPVRYYLAVDGCRRKLFGA